MKTIEEKAKAYDESLERAKEQLNGAKVFDYDNEQIAHDIRTTVYSIFPELKESEDERIRQKLLFLCYSWRNNEQVNIPDKEEVEKTIAWLEKQGKHANFRNKIQIGDKVTRNDNGELVNLSQLERVAKKLEKQEEQKPVEEYNITGIGSKNAQGKLGEMIKNLNPVNEVLEHNPAWSEEDEEMLRRCISATFDHGYLRECDWLKSIKDRVGNFEDGYKVGFSAAKHNQWKPSDAQMASITCAVRKMKGSSCYDSELVSLYQDLMKLKG